MGDTTPKRAEPGPKMGWVTHARKNQPEARKPWPETTGKQSQKAFWLGTKKPKKKPVTGVPSRQVLSTGPKIEKKERKRKKILTKIRPTKSLRNRSTQEKSRKTTTKNAIPRKDTSDTRESPASGQYAFSASALGEKIHLPLGPCGSALRASENVGQRPFLPLSVV